MHIHTISGGKLTDTVFTLDVDPPITWNVTRLQEAAECGLFGRPIDIPTKALKEPDYESGNLERDKVQRFKAMPEVLKLPGLVIESPPNSPYPLLCFCDGQHRATALQEMGAVAFSVYIIPHEIEKQFRVHGL